jgi:hypothetical protein
MKWSISLVLAEARLGYAVNAVSATVYESKMERILKNKFAGLMQRKYKKTLKHSLDCISGGNLWKKKSYEICLLLYPVVHV